MQLALLEADEQEEQITMMTRKLLLLLIVGEMIYCWVLFPVMYLAYWHLRVNCLVVE